jgi:hypothetical protein
MPISAIMHCIIGDAATSAERWIKVRGFKAVRDPTRGGGDLARSEVCYCRKIKGAPIGSALCILRP